MKIDIVTVDKPYLLGDVPYIKTTISLIGDDDGLIALRDIINMKLKLKNNISSTLVLTSDYSHSTHLNIKLEGE